LDYRFVNDFKVKTPFSKSLFAYLLYFLGFVLLVLIALSFQKRKYRKEKEKIEQKKEEQISQQKQEFDELSKQSEQLINQLKAEKLEVELRTTNNLLAASTVNLVSKNELLGTIRKDLSSLKNRFKDNEIEPYLQRMVVSIDGQIKVKEDWKQFEHHFDKVHGDFLERLRSEFDLSPSEQKLSAYLRLNLSSKEIANLMNISTRGVEIARYRLRKKLMLEKGTNLSKFILAY